MSDKQEKGFLESFFGSKKSSPKVEELIKDKLPEATSGYIQKAEDATPFNKYETVTYSCSMPDIKEYTKPRFFEVLTEYNDGSINSDKNTIVRFLCDKDDPEFSLNMELTPRQNSIDNDKYKWEHYVSINLSTLYFDSKEEAITVYEKFKEMVIGKGNNYIQINHGKVNALTIPTSKKKKEGKNDTSRTTSEIKGCPF